jgi:hypothetical protein
MGLLPKLDFDILATVNEFLTILRSMDNKLDTLIAIERDRDAQARKDKGQPACRDCNEGGRLRCPKHGPVKVPGVGPVRLTEVPDDIAAEDMQPDILQVRGMTCAGAIIATGLPCRGMCTHDTDRRVGPTTPSHIADPDCFR